MSSGEPSTSIHAGGSSPNEGTVEEQHSHHHINNGQSTSNNNEDSKVNNNSNNYLIRKERPSRACTARALARVQAAAAAEAATSAAERKKRVTKKERLREREREESPSPPPPQTPQCKIITPLVREPPPSQQQRWDLRSMWELASILNFLNVFRPLLNIKVEFSAEELETALITPNNTLADIHIPLMKAIPPVTRMALGRNTWVTVLCRKLRDWWQWVAEGDLPIVASHGAEIETYNTLDPCTRVVILKALCDIRVEQEDIRLYIDDAIKNGAQLSLFRKERVGGDSYGISYWYEDDPIIGHRLYREIRKVDVQKGKGKNAPPIDNSCFNWETVATNLDEFQDVSDKLFESKNRTEVSLGKKLKIDILPEIEKVHKRKEKQLKKQHRQALLLDNMMNMDGLTAGRSLRDRKPVTYTFDAFDRSINEAIKITKKQSSPEPTGRQEHVLKHDVSANGKWNGDPVQPPQLDSFEMPSPMSPDYDDVDVDEDLETEMTDRSNRKKRRPQRYSTKDYVEAISENEEPDFDSDDDIVGEAVYDEEYLRQRSKQKRKMSSSSEGDEWDEENLEEEDEEEEDDNNFLSMSEDSDEPRRNKKKLPIRTTRESTKLRPVSNLQAGLRRSRRATRNRIDYKQYEMSESEDESTKPRKSNVSDEEFSEGEKEMEIEEGEDEPLPEREQKQQTGEEEECEKPLEKSRSPCHEDGRRFLDLNELAPGFGFDDGPSSTKDEVNNNNNNNNTDNL
ncbi:DDT domain-containing protein DDR4-like isoform X2 [Impatiens glandulifera]|uniref:DDT domain-containing protein DDR4-like isoform X2 n=1 Tax=Impatiens glandulifera TaxID=253017 RepID=UPI001FB07E91|nr:DDT domain-containing protein DDR4-like isoform X2 [Impatiens glandulifera]